MSKETEKLAEILRKTKYPRGSSSEALNDVLLDMTEIDAAVYFIGISTGEDRELFERVSSSVNELKHRIRTIRFVCKDDELIRQEIIRYIELMESVLRCAKKQVS